DSYKDRDYFKDVVNNNTLEVPGLASERFTISQVTSWVDGHYKTAVSIPGTVKGTVAVLSCYFQSTCHPILPLGYLFAITDHEGNVLYHSDSTRNGNENLLEEFSHS